MTNLFLYDKITLKIDTTADKGVFNMKISFAKDCWDNIPFEYAYTYRFHKFNKFTQEVDCIKNLAADNDEDFGCPFENISILSNEKYGAGTSLSTTCSFESYGAPLIVMANELEKGENGVLRYGNYFEVVLYEKGINVWQMKMDEAKKVTWTKLSASVFEVSHNTPHLLKVKIAENGIWTEALGVKTFVYVPDMPKAMHVGIDACEGINRFYDFAIDEE